MKYYVLNSIDRIKQYSKQLDAEAILYNKSFEVLNEDHSKEVFIFRPNNELLLSINGIVQKGKWELLPNSNLLIDINKETYLLKPQFVDNKYLSLQLSGNENSLILIDEELKEQLLLDTLQAFESYLLTQYGDKEQKQIDDNITVQEKRIESVGDTSEALAIRVAIITLIIVLIWIFFIYNSL